MNPNLAHAELDRQIRASVYDQCYRTGRVPTAADVSAALAQPLAEVEAAFHRLAEAHLLVLQDDRAEILMAMPFSAIPTAFQVETSAQTYFGNCIWDALGIPAMLGQDAVIRASCGDCGAAMTLEIINGALQPSAGFAHFALPARQWWDNIVFT